ncbi:MAG: NAD-dependent protein deacylase [Lachnospiraceae bacterium]|nr:NAD-dependent protein deacylase [Lachnospiraceae bacterium]
MDQKVERLTQILKESNHIVFFGGAGVSTASNIPDFRSSNGLYSKKLNRNFSPEEAVSHSFLMQHPEEFYDFYKKNLLYPDAKPNDCHKALAALEEMGKLDAIVTQNIDGLHQKAGSKVVYELHGTTLSNYCLNCHKRFDVSYIIESEGEPICDACGGKVRPDVVLYEEGLDTRTIEASVNAIAHADTLIIGGTSLVVYPAAGLVQYFRGKHLVLINKSATSQDAMADLLIQDDIAKVMKQAVDGLKE